MGLLDAAKDKLNDVKESAKDKYDDAKKAVKDKCSDAKKAVKDKYNEVKSNVETKAKNLKEDADAAITYLDSKTKEAFVSKNETTFDSFLSTTTSTKSVDSSSTSSYSVDELLDSAIDNIFDGFDYIFDGVSNILDGNSKSNKTTKSSSSSSSDKLAAARELGNKFLSGLHTASQQTLAVADGVFGLTWNDKNNNGVYDGESELGILGNLSKGSLPYKLASTVYNISGGMTQEELDQYIETRNKTSKTVSDVKEYVENFSYEDAADDAVKAAKNLKKYAGKIINRLNSETEERLIGNNESNYKSFLSTTTSTKSVSSSKYYSVNEIADDAVNTLITGAGDIADDAEKLTKSVQSTAESGDYKNSDIIPVVGEITGNIIDKVQDTSKQVLAIADGVLGLTWNDKDDDGVYDGKSESGILGQLDEGSLAYEAAGTVYNLTGGMDNEELDSYIKTRNTTAKAKSEIKHKIKDVIDYVKESDYN